VAKVLEAQAAELDDAGRDLLVSALAEVRR
jgi:hypothetical protein